MNAARGRNRAWTRNADALCALMREATAALYACHGRAGVTIHLPARGRLLLTDLGSSNGSFIRLDEETEVKHGDVLLMGQQLFRIGIP